MTWSGCLHVIAGLVAGALAAAFVVSTPLGINRRLSCALPVPVVVGEGRTDLRRATTTYG